MARKSRPVSAAGIYHVMLRGIGELFLDDADYDAFMGLLGKYFHAGAVQLYGYLLLHNRVHLILCETGGKAAAALKPMSTSYARYFNRTHRREGKLFYDRYKSTALDGAEEAAEALRFIHMIPRILGLGDWAYSSRADYLGGGGICDTDAVARLVGANTDLTGQDTPRLGMDDYQRLTDAELERYMQALCGYDFGGFQKLSKGEKNRVLQLLGAQKWVSMVRLSALLDTSVNAIARNKPPESRRKPEKKQEKKKKEELSVWLL